MVYVIFGSGLSGIGWFDFVLEYVLWFEIFIICIYVKGL